jgi:hypothetical protein
MKVICLCFFSLITSLLIANEGNPKELHLESFANKSIHQRKVLYTEQSPSVQSRLWKQQLEASLFTEDLDDIQIDFILYVSSLIENGLLMHDKSDSLYDLKVEKTVANLEEKAVELFPKDQLIRIFVSLGGPDTDHLDTHQSSKLDACQCSTESDFCGLFSNCIRYGPFICFVTPAGCGFLWRYGCNGLCS